MRIVLAGAYGHLGTCILKELLEAGHTVTAIDMIINDTGLSKDLTNIKADLTDPDSVSGICKGADIVISTVGLTKASATVSNYDIDFCANMNLLKEAKSAHVGQFVYVSVLKADMAPNVPMLHAKYMFEQELKKSGIRYVILRPTGYFYDIIKVFRPMIEKGEVTLIGKKSVHANVISTEDMAKFILKHMTDENSTYDIGGMETYSYEEIAEMCFAAAGKEPVIKRVPALLFDILAFVNKLKKNGKEAILRFSKWTLTEEMVAKTAYGEMSFKDYITENFKKE